MFSADNSLLLLAEDDGVLRVKAAHVEDETISQFAGPMEESAIRRLSQLLNLGAGKELVTVPVVAHGSINGFLAVVRKEALIKEEMAASPSQIRQQCTKKAPAEFKTGEVTRQRDERWLPCAIEPEITNILESIRPLTA